MIYMTKKQFKEVLQANDTYDQTLIDTDDHGWSTYQFVVEVDQFCIDELGIDPEFLGTFWALDVNIQPEWGIEWSMCYDEPQQVEQKEVLKYEWKAVK